MSCCYPSLVIIPTELSQIQRIPKARDHKKITNLVLYSPQCILDTAIKPNTLHPLKTTTTQYSQCSVKVHRLLHQSDAVSIRILLNTYQLDTHFHFQTRIKVKVTVKVECVSSWLCLLRYVTMMHGQQNIK
jgi:hypothetical protein